VITKKTRLVIICYTVSLALNALFWLGFSHELSSAGSTENAKQAAIQKLKPMVVGVFRPLPPPPPIVKPEETPAQAADLSDRNTHTDAVSTDAAHSLGQKSDTARSAASGNGQLKAIQDQSQLSQSPAQSSGSSAGQQSKGGTSPGDSSDVSSGDNQAVEGTSEAERSADTERAASIQARLLSNIANSDSHTAALTQSPHQLNASTQARANIAGSAAPATNPTSVNKIGVSKPSTVDTAQTHPPTNNPGKSQDEQISALHASSRSQADSDSASEADGADSDNPESRAETHPLDNDKPVSNIVLKQIQMWSPKPGQKFNLATNLNISFPQDVQVIAGPPLTEDQIQQIEELMRHQHLLTVKMSKEQVQHLAEMRRQTTSQPAPPPPPPPAKDARHREAKKPQPDPSAPHKPATPQVAEISMPRPVSPFKISTWDSNILRRWAPSTSTNDAADESSSTELAVSEGMGQGGTSGQSGASGQGSNGSGQRGGAVGGTQSASTNGAGQGSGNGRNQGSMSGSGEHAGQSAESTSDGSGPSVLEGESGDGMGSGGDSSGENGRDDGYGTGEQTEEADLPAPPVPGHTVPGALALPPSPPVGTTKGTDRTPHKVRMAIIPPPPSGAFDDQIYKVTWAAKAQTKVLQNTDPRKATKAPVGAPDKTGPKPVMIALTIGSVSANGQVPMTVMKREHLPLGTPSDVIDPPQMPAKGIPKSRLTQRLHSPELALFERPAEQPSPKEKPVPAVSAVPSSNLIRFARNSHGIKDGSEQPLPPTPLPDSNALIGDGSGLKGDYYEGPRFDQFVFSRADPNVDYDWITYPTQSPGPGIVAYSDYTVRWTGRIVAPYSETYTFYAAVDDGVRVWINHKLVLDDWSAHPLSQFSNQFTFQAGQQYLFKCEYLEVDGGGASVYLYWESPHTPKEFVPEDAFFYPLPSDVQALKQDTKPY
jgi:hypothetical protein